MEAIGKIILTTILTRFVKRHKLKVHIYQLVFRKYVEQFYNLLSSKYSLYRNEFQEKTKRNYFLMHLAKMKRRAGQYFGKIYIQTTK